MDPTGNDCKENSNAYRRNHFLCKHIGSVENCFFHLVYYALLFRLVM